MHRDIYANPRLPTSYFNLSCSCSCPCYINHEALSEVIVLQSRASSMSAITEELNEIFAIPPINELPPDVSGELQSICRLHSISPKELSYKWESYSMKMGSEQTTLDLPTARAFKKDLQELVEREARSKSHLRSAERRGAYATPRNNAKGGDAFGMYVQVKPVCNDTADTSQAGWYHAYTAINGREQQAKSTFRDSVCAQIQQG